VPFRAGRYVPPVRTIHLTAQRCRVEQPPSWMYGWECDTGTVKIFLPSRASIERSLAVVSILALAHVWGRLRARPRRGTVTASSLPALSALEMKRPMPLPSPGGASPAADADEVASLATIYTADRADTASSMNVALALLGAGIAYVAATLAFSGTLSRSLGWITVFLPFPLWLIAAFHSLIAISAMIRSISITQLETLLLQRTRIDSDRIDTIGFRAPERIGNVTQAAWPHAIASVLSYGGVALIVIGYTTYMIVNSQRLPELATLLAAAGYATLTLLVAASWRYGFAIYARSEKHFKEPHPDHQ
jgi:hypothetical protein